MEHSGFARPSTAKQRYLGGLFLDNRQQDGPAAVKPNQFNAVVATQKGVNTHPTWLAFTKVLSGARITGEWSGDIPVDLGARHLHGQIGLVLALSDLHPPTKR